MLVIFVLFIYIVRYYHKITLKYVFYMFYSLNFQTFVAGILGLTTLLREVANTHTHLRTHTHTHTQTHTYTHTHTHKHTDVHL